MSTTPRNIGARLYWWGILALRLMFTHPAKWRGARLRWERDRERATMPPEGW